MANPLLKRFLRAELRGSRLLIAGGISLFLCFLLREAHNEFLGTRNMELRIGRAGDSEDYLFYWFAVLQWIVLPLWCLVSSLHAVTSERQMRTFDFVRTTRLTSRELLVGYLLGPPVLGFVTVGLSIIVAIGIGVREGVPGDVMAINYVELIVASLMIGLLGLLASTLIDKSWIAGVMLVLVFVAFGLTLSAGPQNGTAFPGLFAFSALGVISGRISFEAPLVPIFDQAVPVWVLTLVLYASCAAWTVLGIVRNIKKDRGEVRIFSNLQALGFAIFANIVLIGMLSPTNISAIAHDYAISNAGVDFLVMNTVLLYAVGLTTLAAAERLQVWCRRLRNRWTAVFSTDAPPLLWLTLAAVVGFATYAFIAYSSSEIGALEDWHLDRIALGLATILVYVARDVLFLQWCLATRMRYPLAKGVGLISIYYASALLFSHFWNSPAIPQLPIALREFTPASAFERYDYGDPEWIGMAMQLALAIVFVLLTLRRLGTGPRVETVRSESVAA